MSIGWAVASVQAAKQILFFRREILKDKSSRLRAVGRGGSRGGISGPGAIWAP